MEERMQITKGFMTDEQKRELDGWLAEHVMGFKPTGKSGKNTLWHNPAGGWNEEFNPTESPADAFAVLQKCLAESQKRHRAIELMRWSDGKITMFSDNNLQAGADTLELAICLFAKQLFGK